MRRTCRILCEIPKRMTEEEAVALLNKNRNQRSSWQVVLAGWKENYHQHLLKDFETICEQGALGPVSAGVFLQKLSICTKGKDLLDSYHAIIAHGIKPNEDMLSARFQGARNEGVLEFMWKDLGDQKITKKLILEALWSAQRLLRKRNINHEKLNRLTKKLFLLLRDFPVCEEVLELRLLCSSSAAFLSQYLLTLRHKKQLSHKLMSSSLKAAVRLGAEEIAVKLHEEITSTSRDRNQRGLATTRLLLHYANTGDIRSFLKVEASNPAIDRSLEVIQGIFLACCANCIQHQEPFSGVITRIPGRPTINQVKKLAYDRLPVLRSHSTWKSTAFQKALLNFYHVVGDDEGMTECQQYDYGAVQGFSNKSSAA